MNVRWLRWIPIRRLRAFGAPIYVHQSVLIAIALILTAAFNNFFAALIAAASYLTIILVHEFGHAVVARALHCEVTAIRIGLIHGNCEFELPHSALEHAAIAWGGVLAQLLVALCVGAIAALIDDRKLPYVGIVVVILGYVNVMIAIINIAPARGLDGFTAWRLVPEMLRRQKSRSVVRSALRRAARRRQSKS